MATRDGYRGASFPTFGGLDFRSDPQDGPLPAVDLLNVDFELGGRVRSRDGTTQLYTANAIGDPISALPVYFNSAVRRLIIREDADHYTSINYPSGTVAHTSTMPVTNMITGWAQVGGTLYFATYTSGIKAYDGFTFTDATITDPGALGANSGRYLTVQLPDTRLVSAAGDRVCFSNGPSAITTFSADDYVDLSKGDGESIVGAVTWNNQTFVFKQSAFFVFYGNSTDSVGGAVFNYRTVRHNLPPVLYQRGTTLGSFNTVVAGRDGVYFLARDGIYMTTGGQPVKISAPLDPLFTGADPPPYYSGSLPEIRNAALYYAQNKLIFIYGPLSGVSTRLYVFDTVTRQWAAWDFGVTGNMIGFASITDPGAAGREEMVLCVANGASTIKLLRTDNTVATDNGGAMSSSYQTGFVSLGDDGAQKRVREWLLHGTGTFQVRTAVDDQSAFEAAAASPSGPFGTGPVYEYRHRRASRGRNISLRVQSTGAWSLSRAIANVAEQRPESVRGDG